jgi:plasmid stabilization system protein ParE
MVSRFANSHQIRISTAAAKDILEIYDYVVEFDSEANADRLIAKLAGTTVPSHNPNPMLRAP